MGLNTRLDWRQDWIRKHSDFGLSVPVFVVVAEREGLANDA